MVERLKQVAENVMIVRYRYRKDITNSRAAQAMATTTYDYARALIERIVANF